MTHQEYMTHCYAAVKTADFRLNDQSPNFHVLLTMHLSIFISVINQLDAQNFCFTISLFHASTCFEHMYSSSGGQNCLWYHHTYSPLNLCTRRPPIGVMILEAV